MSDLFLNTLSFKAAQRLAADPFFKEVPIFEQAQGIIEQEVINSLSTLNSRNGKRGACILVRHPFVKTKDNKAPLCGLNVCLEIECREVPQFNRVSREGGTGKTLDQMWTNAARLLEWWNIEQLAQVIFLDEKPMEVIDTGSELIAVARFYCKYPIEPRGKVTLGSPTVETVSPGNYRAKISTGTEGTAVCFKVTPADELAVTPTLDNAAPLELDEWFEFSLSVPSNLLAVGYKTDHLASDERHVAFAL
jgi:hypothetical protein